MAKVNASIVINKPLQEVFDYTVSPANGPAFIPNLSENTNIQPEQTGVGQTFDWRFNLSGVDLKGKAEVVEYDKPNKVVIKTTGESDSTWTYSFQQEGEGTRVSVEVDYAIAESALQRLVNKVVVDQLNQRSAEQSLENLKTILEG